MKVFIDTLGCPKALIDAEKYTALIAGAGHEIVFYPEDADAVLVNTCGFIRTAKEESIDTILEYAAYKKKRPDMKLIVSGCLTERYESEISSEIPEIDAQIGVRDPLKVLAALEAPGTKSNLDRGDYLDIAVPRGRLYQFSGFMTSYLKIAEGCKRQCAFCAIPGIRGIQRSRTADDIVEEAKQLVDDGFREIVLVSEDTVSYGTDLTGRKMLIPLVERLLKLDLGWLRVMYLFPDETAVELASLMRSEPKLCSYVDLPLQHASPRVLRAMNRPGDAGEYADLIDRLRFACPDIALRTSFMLGFPGETDEDYKILEDFITAMKFDRVGFFDYSDEEGTPAYALQPKVSDGIAKERRESLEDLQTGLSRERLSRLVGEHLVCLNEGLFNESDSGVTAVMRTQFDAPEIDGVVNVEMGKVDPDSLNDLAFAKVRIDAVWGNHDLRGTYIENAEDSR